MHGFWTWQLCTAMALNLIMQALQVGAYGSRIAGVRTGRIATAIALFGLVVTVSRTANMLYAPLVGTLSDAASHVPGLHPAGAFEWELRAVVFAGTIGTIAGACLLPVFVGLYVRGIAALDRHGSVPRATLRLANPAVVRSIIVSVRLPNADILRRSPLRSVPPALLWANLVLSAVYAIGVVAAQYASVIDPDTARSALMLSSIINGAGTIAFAFIVDPTSAAMVDGAVRGQRTIGQVRTMVVWLSLTSIAGTLLGQLLFLPSAELIAFVARIVAR
jgi:Alternate to MurJ